MHILFVFGGERKAFYDHTTEGVQKGTDGLEKRTTNRDFDVR